MMEARAEEFRLWQEKTGGTYGEWRSEHMKTMALPRETVIEISRLNIARDAARQAARAAQEVDDMWCRIAALLIAAAGKLLLLGTSSYSRRALNTNGEENMLKLAFMLMLLMLAPGLAFAQASLPADLETGDALQLLLKSLGGLKGAGALAIAVVITQGIMLFFRTKLSSFAGKWRLLIVAGLSLVTGFLSLLVSGVSWQGALMHAETIGAFQVLGHQLFVQFGKTD